MTRREKFFFGGLGAIVPIAINLIALDPKTTFLAFNVAVFGGYVIRCLVMFGLGGLSVCFDEEVNPRKLIHMGIAAPAMFASLIATSNVTPPPSQASTAQLSIVHSVYASEPGRELQPKDFADKEPGVVQQVYKGFTGQKPDGTHYLIIHESDDILQAKSFAKEMLSELDKKDLLQYEEGKPPLTVQLYLPYKDVLKYSVVLAERLSHEEAHDLVKLLLERDFKGVQIFDLSCSCFPDKTKGAS